MRYGRNEDEWDELVEAGLEFLVERAGNGQLTSYTELNDALADRTGWLASTSHVPMNEPRWVISWASSWSETIPPQA